MNAQTEEHTQDQLREVHVTDRWLAAGGIVGAVVASTCCVVPLALVLLGVSGSWISQLTAFAPYKPYFLVGSIALLGVGFRRVYFQPPAPCAPGSICAVPATRRGTRAALWSGTVIVAVAASVDWWAPLLW